MKFAKILVQRLTNIFDLLLDLLWRLKTTSSPFYGFDEMASYGLFLVDVS